MKTIFLVILLALTMSLPGCVGPGESQKGVSGNASSTSAIASMISTPLITTTTSTTVYTTSTKRTAQTVTTSTLSGSGFGLVYIQGFDLKMNGGQETSRLDTNAGEYSRQICPAAGAQIKTITLNLSDPEKKTIHDSFVKNQIWAIDHDFTENCQPDNESWPDRICQSTTPGDYSILQVRWDGQNKTIEWTVDYINSSDNDQQLARYKSFEEDLQKVLDNKIEAMAADFPGCVYD